MPDPRNNADDAYEVFMSMDQKEWLYNLMHSAGMTNAELEGLLRAKLERRFGDGES